MMSKVEKAMKKAIREQIERVMRPIWDNKVPDVSLPPEKQELVDELESAIGGTYHSYDDRALRRMVNLLLKEMGSPVQLTGSHIRWPYSDGEWVFVEMDKTGYYKAEKPVVCLSGRKCFIPSGRADWGPRPPRFGEVVGTTLPAGNQVALDSELRYPTEAEMRKFMKNISMKNLKALYFAMDHHGLL